MLGCASHNMTINGTGEFWNAFFSGKGIMDDVNARSKW